MKFTVLGTLRIVDDVGAPEPVTSLRQRQLLGVLLSRPGRSASTDLLLEQVWSGAPPKTAGRNLHTYVHRLRARLGHGTLASAPGTYRLVTEPGDIDADRFERLAEAGRAALGSDDTETAASTLADALALWRGEPFADLADRNASVPDSVEVEATRLRELRLAILEDHADAELRLGRHATQVSGLLALLAEHPLRERLRAQLMLALYRSGRTSEALEIYRAGRAELIEELGTEPGEHLRELERAILNEDPRLDPPRPGLAMELASLDRTPSTAAPVVPAELPPYDRRFTGRDVALDQVVGALSPTDRPRVVAIDGPGGVGKSALALAAAARMAPSFPDGQMYVDVRGATPGAEPLTAAAVLGRCLRSLGYDDADIPDDLDEAAVRLRSLTSSRALLLVCDNVASAAQIRPVVPAIGPSAVIITSRPPLTALDGAHHLRLAALREHDALTLLSEFVGREPIAADPDSAERIIDLCGRLPLALRIAGARYTSRSDWTLARLAERLADTGTRLDELAHDDLAMAASCQVSYQALPTDTARLFALLGVVDLHPVTPQTAAALLGEEPARARRHLDRLVEAQLMTADGERHTLQGLVHLYAAERARTLPPAVRATAVRRLAHHYLAVARTVAEMMSYAPARLRVAVDEVTEPCGRPNGVDLESVGADGPGEAVAWLRCEADNIVATAERALTLGPDGVRVTVALAAALTPGYDYQNRCETALSLNRLALRGIEEHGLEDCEMRVRRDMATELRQLGQLEAAEHHLQVATQIARRRRDSTELASIFNAVAITFGCQGRTSEEIAAYERALGHAVESGDERGEVTALNNLANRRRAQGRIGEAHRLLQRCLAIHERLGKSNGMAVALGTLAEVCLDLRDPEQASRHADRSVRMHRELGSAEGEAYSLWRLSEALANRSRAADARRHRDRSLRVCVDTALMTSERAEALLASGQTAIPRELRH